MTLTAQAAFRKDKSTKTELQHRHFAFIAASMAGMREAINIDAKTWESACRFMATECAATNDRFDRARFLKACGIE